MIGGDSVRCTLEMLRVETVPGAWTPVAPARAAGGRWVLEDSAGSAGFPLRNWALEPGGDSRAWLRPEPGGVRVQTLGTPGSLAAQYPAMRAQTAGLYRFAMRYWRVGGVIRFGAYRAGQPGQWLASASRPYWDGNDPDLIFWVRLAAGEEFQLGIANRNDAPGLPASFLMKGITAVRVADTAADAPR
jgi:hypothetical protein